MLQEKGEAGEASIPTRDLENDQFTRYFQKIPRENGSLCLSLCEHTLVEPQVKSDRELEGSLQAPGIIVFELFKFSQAGF